MALIDYIYNDANLTDQFDDATDTLGAAAVNGASSAAGVFYIGTPTATNKLEEANDPGVNNITVSIVDATPGSNVDDLDIKLATSEANLATAVGGNPLSVGVTINGGTGTAVPVYYQWDNSTGGSTYTNISLSVSPMVEGAI